MTITIEMIDNVRAKYEAEKPGAKKDALAKQHNKLARMYRAEQRDAAEAKREAAGAGAIAVGVRRDNPKAVRLLTVSFARDVAKMRRDVGKGGSVIVAGVYEFKADIDAVLATLKAQLKVNKDGSFKVDHLKVGEMLRAMPDIGGFKYIEALPA